MYFNFPSFLCLPHYYLGTRKKTFVHFIQSVKKKFYPASVTNSYYLKSHC